VWVLLSLRIPIRADPAVEARHRGRIADDQASLLDDSTAFQGQESLVVVLASPRLPGPT
jgi:hypothetical protein